MADHVHCDREELLANFQAATGIDDIGEALLHLEATEWNLLEAMNRVIPQESQVLPSVAGDGPRIQELVEPAHGGASGSLSLPQLPSQVSGPADAEVRVSVALDDDEPGGVMMDTVPLRILFYGRVLEITLPASETVGTLRIVLQAQTDLAPCQQDLRLEGQPLDDNSVKLSSIHPGQLLTLQQSSSAAAGGSLSYHRLNTASTSSSSVSSVPGPSAATAPAEQYQLTICDLTSGREYRLGFPGDTQVSRVKSDAHALTEIPIRHQIWEGWPPHATDSHTLAGLGIGTEHRLSLDRLPVSNNSGSGSGPPAAAASCTALPTVDMGSDASSVEYQDAAEVFDETDDALFVQEERPKRIPLIPESNAEELAGVLHFCEQFEARYGACHPAFYHGTLHEAAEEACAKPVTERRVLAVYLHYDSSVLANVFCSQLLCTESVVSYLTNNFVVWGWDITYQSNQDMFLERVTSEFGSRTREALLMSMDRDRLPLLLLLMRSRSTTEILSVVHANTSVDELMGTLIHAQDMFSHQMSVERREEEERRQREDVKQEQDRAYQESLQADRAKEEARRAEREQVEQRERQQREERERQESERQQQEALREAVRRSLESDLPPEPADPCSQPVTTIRFRAPDGSTFVRRFLAEETLQVLLNYVTVKGYDMEHYKLISSWPRRDVSGLDSSATLSALKLCPQETLMLEER